MLRGTIWIIGVEGSIGPRLVLELPAQSSDDFRNRARSKVLHDLAIGDGYTLEFGPIGEGWGK